MKNSYSPVFVRATRLTGRYIWTLLVFIVRNVNDFITINGHYMAATIAFYTMLCLFPLSLMLITVTSWILGGEGTERVLTAFVGGLEQVFPVLAGETAQNLVVTLSDNLRNFTGFSTPLAIIFTAVASLAVFSSIRKSINLVWGITKPRSFLAEKLIDVAMSIGAIFLLFLSVAVTSISANLDNILSFLFPNTTFDTGGLQNLIGLSSWVIGLLVFWVLYWWLPATKVRFWHVFPTALGATIAFEISKIAFLQYLANTGALLGSIYGVFSAVIVFLTFVYVSSIILLAGAMLSSKFITALNVWERKRLNNALRENLQRVRTSQTLVGLSASLEIADKSVDRPA